MSMSNLALVAAKNNNNGSGVFSLIFFALIFVAMYFLLLRPQRRRMKTQQSLQRSITIGDEVLMNSGIIGFVEDMDGEIVWVSIADGVLVRVTRNSLARRIDPTVETAGGIPAEDDKGESEAD